MMAIKSKRALVWSALAASFYTQGGRVAWSALAASKLHVTASPAHPRTLKRQFLSNSIREVAVNREKSGIAKIPQSRVPDTF